MEVGKTPGGGGSRRWEAEKGWCGNRSRGAALLGEVIGRRDGGGGSSKGVANGRQGEKERGSV